ncbi:ABC transporter permease [Alkalihalobacillus alcalophilus ATCC 27647 = CGMCC 1.3604]|uniref:ABC transporter permease n=1 Tax=Alkalihalobacillus alcalophilus ATCC 27647 = CGMCC 1.3604 TaxID=1218173 RepID=J8TF10_ALKAL|nr:sugar ABC transporter permease [Alkalihalobacillus alcalophilus]AFV25979.1 sugar transporter [Alkalihalobacillus alcalophilus ATCC 27647 = CGMCC 1.3604]KGA97630.1 ABC transporter permease [Alkalihalobacillus alcalophilus ATCC 27647 = CGMCC 1.3604]MED1561418.1 sugar ABC transporter permease [Alkalihalobacillus alcalophilus]THG90692.1 ABC transporter permease [Alkalihalobacillus alcalophilus ATCC 27647 = CGMCC 1.3604]
MSSLPNLEQKEKAIKTMTKEKRNFRQNLVAYAFISPWLFGFIAIIVGPMIYSLYLSFTSYDLLSAPRWIGFDNYIRMFTNDPRFWTTLKVTLIFVAIAVPLRLVFALAVAMLMNTGHRGSGFYSLIYYVPSIIGGSVAVAVIWRQIFGREGALNHVLSWFGVEGYNWFAHPDYALSVLILLIVWQFGSPMVIFLAGLKQIPQELYEAAAVDGSNKIQSFFNITLPMLTPVIFFNLIFAIINGFLTFTQAFLITAGGPIDRTLLYALYLYQNAFEYFRMGYASALAWVLLVIIGAFTAIIFLTSKKWVYYESEGGKS